MDRMKKYVGTPNITADSRIPRRLPQVSRHTMAKAIHALCAPSAGKADTTAAAPEQLDTATVSI